jgi:hypothetical protein
MSKRAMLLTAAALWLLTLSAFAAVTLKYFRVASVTSKAVTLEWETATELDHALFILSRAEAEDGPYEKIGDFPARGDAVSGAYYDYVDEDVTPGTTYWYKLEDMDNNGNVSLAHPVISADVPAEEGGPTPTPGIPADTPTPEPGVTASPAPTDTPPAAATDTPAPAPTEQTPPAEATPTATTVVIQPTATPPPATPTAPATPQVTPPVSETPTTPPFPTPLPTPPASGGGSANLLLLLGIGALVAAGVVGFIAFRMFGK